MLANITLKGFYYQAKLSFFRLVSIRTMLFVFGDEALDNYELHFPEMSLPSHMLLIPTVQVAYRTEAENIKVSCHIPML